MGNPARNEPRNKNQNTRTKMQEGMKAENHGETNLPRQKEHSSCNKKFK
jgi:hypothetical protein